jgi:predicted CoA-binding protein
MRAFSAFVLDGLASAIHQGRESVSALKNRGRFMREIDAKRFHLKRSRSTKMPMIHDRYDDAYIRDLLGSVKTVAMVGASANSNRPSYFALKYLLGKGYDVHPVNPGLAGQQILQRTVYARLADVPAPVDMVDIFRNSDAALDVTREAIALQTKLAIKVIWMQLGVRNDTAAAEAEAAGMSVVMNRCPKIEYGRLSGEIGWAGVNAGFVTSRRPLLGKGMQNQIIATKR